MKEMSMKKFHKTPFHLVKSIWVHLRSSVYTKVNIGGQEQERYVQLCTAHVMMVVMVMITMPNH